MTSSAGESPAMMFARLLRIAAERERRKRRRRLKIRIICTTVGTFVILSAVTWVIFRFLV